MKTKQTIIHPLILCTGLFLLAGAGALKATNGTDTWTGGAGDNNWGTAGNWSGVNAPPIAGDGPTFGAQGAGGLTLNNNITPAGTSYTGLSFNSTAPAFILNGNSIATTGGFTDSATNLETVNLAVAWSASHSMNVVNAGGSLTVNGLISGAGADTLNKTGAGLLTLTGKAAGANTFGPTEVSDGTLVLDFSQGGSTPASNIDPADALTVGGGGTLQIIGSSSASSSQSFSGITLIAGASTITAAPVSGSNIPTVALGAISSTPAGGTVVLNGPAYSSAPTTVSGATGSVGNSDPNTGLQAATAKITTTGSSANTVLVSGTSGASDYCSFATVGLYDFAAASGSTPFTIAGYSQVSGGTGNDGGYYLETADFDDAGLETGNSHYDDIAASFSVPSGTGTTTFGGLRYNYNGAITTTVNAVFSVTGILVTPNVGANNTTIAIPSGYLCPGLRSSSNAGSLALYQNNTNGFLIFNGSINDGKTLGGTVSQAGAGTVVLEGVNTNSGSWYLNGGVTEITIDTNLGYGLTGAAVNMDGGTILGNATFTMDNGGASKRPVALGVYGGGLAAVTGDTMTVDGVVSGAGQLVIGIPASGANSGTVGQVPGTGTGMANASVLATGIVSLSGADTYTGGTVVDSGELSLSSTGTINSTPSITVESGAEFDVSQVSGYTLGGSQSLLGNGTINGSVNTSSGSKIYGDAGVAYGTNIFNNNLTFASGAACYMDVGTVHNGNNDLITVSGALTLNGTTFNLSAPSTSSSLDTTADYVLISAASITGTPNSTPTWIITPANYANFIVMTNGSNQVVLHYSATVPPSGSGVASPSTVTRNESTLFTVIATPGSRPIASVVLNASQIGGSSSVTLVQSNTSSVYTNTVTVSAGTAVGSYNLVATISDTSSPTPLTATPNITLNVVSTQQTWDGAGANNNWSIGLNWSSGFSPGVGDFATFAGMTRLTPSMDSNYSLVGVAFSSGAGSFTLGSVAGTWLTLTADGITNSSASVQTVNMPITLGAAETFNAAAANLTLGGAITNGGNLVSVDGTNLTTISGAISGSGGLTMNGAGTNLVSGNNSFSGPININAGMMQVTGNSSSNSLIDVNAGTLQLGARGMLGGSSLTVGNSTAGTAGTFVLNGGTITTGAVGLNNSGNTAGGTGTVNISSGAASFTSVSIGHNQNGGEVNITGGTVSLGNFNDARDASAANATPSYNAGLVINGGTVTASDIIIASGNSGGNMTVSNGSLTIGNSSTTGGFEIGTGSSTTRGGFLSVGGGSITYTGIDGLLINNAADNEAIANLGGGTFTLTGITLNEAGNTGGSATLTIGGSATVYLGSVGLVENSGSASATINLNGGTIGAIASWSTTAPLTLSGTAFQTTDANGDPFAIALNGTLSGTGRLSVSGTGTLTLGTGDTYTGNTLIYGGSLILAPGASINSPNVSLGAGTTFDVSQTGYTLNSGQTIYGFGTVTGLVTAASGATIYPGSNSVTGTLTFPTGLTENGGVVNEFNLSSNPSGPNNDFINDAGGTLSLSGANTIMINGAVTSGGVYPLIEYGTIGYGDVTDFTVSGATGYLSNNVTGSEIVFVAQATTRGPTNTVWVGNPSVNDWDTEVTTNWLNAGALDFFVSGDNVHFTDAGLGNPSVNFPGTVIPGSVTVNTTGSYTFSGSGWIGGAGSLTMSNGSLTVETANTYTGPTIFDGGVLTTASIANSANPSGIGAATADPGNLIFNGGTLSYNGGSAGTDHGIMLTNSGGTIDVSGGTTLNLNGVVTGPGGLTEIDSGGLTLTVGNTYTGNTTISNGTLTLQNTAAAGTGALVLAGGTVDLDINGQPTYANNLTVTANSTLDSAGGNNNIVNGTWAGNYTVTLNMEMSGGGTFTVNGSMTNFYGTVELGGNTGFFRFNAGGGNTQYGAPNALIDVGTSSATLEARNPGTMAIGALAGLNGTSLKGPSGTAGTLVWQIGASTNMPNSAFYGIIADSASNENGSIMKVGNGTLTLGGQNTYTGATTINSGTLALVNSPYTGNDGSINNSATISLASGTAIDPSGRSDGTLPLGSAQVLTGTGTIRGSLDASGTIEPGTGTGIGGTIGTLIVTNNLTLESSSTNWFKLNRASSPNSDQMVVSNSITFNNGTLEVVNIGTALQAGDTFKLYNSTAASYSGSFNTLVLPTLTGYLGWNTNNLSVNGTVSVVSMAPMSIGSVNFSGLASGTIVLNAMNGPANATVYVLTSTNLTVPVTQWMTNSTTSFDSSGNLTGYSITVNPHAPQLFIQLQAQ